MNKKSLLSLCLTTPLLMSATSISFTNHKSSITNSSFSIVELINSGSSQCSILTQGYNEIAANIDAYYEYYQMGNSTSLLTSYTPAYTLIYKLNIYLNDYVKYKNGLNNWFTATDSTHINSLKINGTFNNLQSANHYWQTPSANNELRIANDIDINSYTIDGSTKFGVPVHYVKDKFTTANVVNSKSYEYKNTDIPTYNLNYGLENKLTTYINSSITNTDLNNGYSRLAFNNTLNYGFSVTSDGLVSKDSDYTHYAGPNKSAGAYYFTIYGTMSFESEVKPNSLSLKVEMEATYGSSRIWDSFTNTASVNISL